MIRRWLRALVALTLAAAAGAAVPTIADVRVLYAPIMGDNVQIEGRLDDESLTGSLHRSVGLGANLRRHTRLGFGAYASLEPLRPGIGSFTYGIELGEDRTTQEQGGPASHETTTGDLWIGDAFVGWSFALTPWWHLEQGLLVGCGEGTWRWQAQGFYINATPDIDESSIDFAYEYGFRVASFWTFAENWQVGVDVRHLVTRSSARFQSAVTNVETLSYRPSIEIRGLAVVGSVGCRF